MRGPVEKYLERWAEPEHRIAARVTASFRAAVVVPVLGEGAAWLGGLEVCARDGALVIVVVNARDDAPAELHEKNAELLDVLSERRQALSSDPPAFIARHRGIDVLVVDRASPGWRLPAGQGVGLARRIGFDLALALVQSGRVREPFIASTDADVSLGEDYVAALAAAPRSVAVTFPFVHVPSGDALLDRATALYESWLDHYVSGLARAGSPFAFHTVGSALAVRADAYAMVRGFPKRLAAEDFHLLDKLAKIGPITQANASPIRIRARRSERVPFGTGPAVARIEAELARGETPRFHHPRSFELLGIWLRALDAFAEHRDETRLRADVAAFPPLPEALRSLGCLEAAVAERAQAPDAARLARRLKSSFGALETLRLIHALRDLGLGCVAGPPQPPSSQPALALR